MPDWCGGGAANISANPQLVPGTYRLKKGAPCMDAGKVAGAPTVDPDGEPRPYGAGVDIGGDEFVDTDGDGLTDGQEVVTFCE